MRELQELKAEQKAMRERHKGNKRAKEFHDIRNHPALMIVCPFCAADVGSPCLKVSGTQIGGMHQQRKIEYIRLGLK